MDFSIYERKPNIDFKKLTLNCKNNIHFQTHSDRDYNFKYVCNYFIDIEESENNPSNVKKRMLGQNGYFLKKIIYEASVKHGDYSTKLRLRGKGSGYLEGEKNEESSEPFQLCVSSLNYSHYIDFVVTYVMIYVTYNNLHKIMQILTINILLLSSFILLKKVI